MLRPLTVLRPAEADADPAHLGGRGPMSSPAGPPECDLGAAKADFMKRYRRSVGVRLLPACGQLDQEEDIRGCAHRTYLAVTPTRIAGRIRCPCHGTRHASEFKTS